MEEDFDDVCRADPVVTGEGYNFDDAGASMEVCDDGDWVEYNNYKRLLKVYKDLRERHQRLLDIAGTHYL